MKLNDKLSRDWHLDNFYNRGYKIEFWDVSNIIHRNNDANKNYQNIKIININNIRDLKENINKLDLKKVFFIITIPCFYQSLSIYKTISKYNLNTAFFYWGESPNLVYKKNIATKILMYFKINKNMYESIKHIYQRLIVKLHRRLGLIKKYTICFTAGELCKTLAYGDKLIPINLCDYDQNLKNKKIEFKEKYAVFLDINLPYNSDVELQGLVKIDPRAYFKSLNSFFDIFERKYDLKVIIAAHPKSKYNNNTFNQRKIYCLKTSELIKSCSHVLIHYSTALSYAVLNYKPVTFFTTHQMKNTYEYYMGKLLSEYLNQPFISLSDINDSNLEYRKDVDVFLYDKYKYNYIVSKESEGKPSFPLIEKSIINYS